jgi:sulfatase maturation enzyme AslB (radical SAM superfamily)
MENGTKGMGKQLDKILRENLFRLPFYISSGIKYHSTGRIYTPKPVIFNLGVSRRCNARCIMCSIWRTKPEKEPTIGELQEIFSNPLLNRLKTVVLSGGEPTLRDDLAQIVQCILASNPRIREIWLVTNALEPFLVRQRVKDILNLSSYSKLKKFGIEVSLDGYAHVHEKIRRIPKAFDRVYETIQMLKDAQSNSSFDIHLNCVVQKLNVNNLFQIFNFAQAMGLPINFIPVAQVLGNRKQFKRDLMPSVDQLKELREFLNHQIAHNIKLSVVAFWQDYFHIIAGAKRKIPCALPYHALGMTPEGDLFICGNDSLVYGNVYDAPIDKIWYSEEAKQIRRKAKKYICPTCAVSCNTSFSLRSEFFYYAKFLLKVALKRSSI